MEDSYMGFLMSIVGVEYTERNVNICKTLFDIPFWWNYTIPLDADRAENGIALRLSYFKETKNYSGIEGEPCRVLEMMVALAMDMDSVVSWSEDPHPERWFSDMLENAGIANIDDQGYIVQVINNILGRTYDHNGKGGFFPLNYSPIDQRESPIWSQASAYICEHVA